MLNFPDFPAPEIEPHPSLYSYSETQFEILKKYVQDFENTLDSEHEVGLLLTHLGQKTVMVVNKIGFEKPVLMVFKGLVDEKPSTLVQHVSQLNLLLTSVDRTSGRQKRPIGFVYPQQ